jgi:RNA recognition motif-containing protein
MEVLPEEFPSKIPPQRSGTHHRMSNTVFLGNLPAWVTADDIKSWLSAENLVADSIKVIRNPETQESKGFAFIEAPNVEEMNSIIRRFDRAPLEDRMLRANPAQPPKSKGGAPVRAAGPMTGPPGGDRNKRPRPTRDVAGGPPAAKRKSNKPQPTSAFAEELAKAL